MKLSASGSETVTLTGQTIDKLIRAGDGDAALLYLYILKTKGESTDSEASKALNKSKGWIASATAMLSRIGLVEVEKDSAPAGNAGSVGSAENRPLQEQHEYTEDEVKAEIAAGSDFTIVIEETQRRLGKILSPDDLLRLYGIYDNLGLPPEVILQLITHCINECHTRGDGRTPSVKYIEQAAYTWEREGVFSIEKAEEYLKALEARKSSRGMIRRSLNITDREFSETEKRYVDSWIDMGFEYDTIAIAYDKTVINTGGLKWPYLDKILKNWHAKDIHTVEQIQENDGRTGTTTAASSTSIANNTGQKHGNPNSEEMERMTKILNKIKEE